MCFHATRIRTDPQLYLLIRLCCPWFVETPAVHSLMIKNKCLTKKNSDWEFHVNFRDVLILVKCQIVYVIPVFIPFLDCVIISCSWHAFYIYIYINSRSGRKKKVLFCSAFLFWVGWHYSSSANPVWMLFGTYSHMLLKWNTFIF